jgi:limonene-1,2-epoxide hydrolase
MGLDQEASLREFLAEFECQRLDSSQVDRLLSHMAPDATYHVSAWEPPFTGLDAIRAELLQQGQPVTDVRIEILSIASSGQTVFTERLDCLTMSGKRAEFHIAGVFEVGDDGKITAWRDYFDTKEMEAHVGAEVRKRTYSALTARENCRSASPDRAIGGGGRR